MNNISVGSGTNIQDNSLVHVAKTNLAGKELPTTIGDNVTIGKTFENLFYVVFLLNDSDLNSLCVKIKPNRS